jgi:thiamine biosynthesis protein ThiI
MKKIILVRYGEIILKGLNRPVFEDKLIKNIKQSLIGFDKVSITKSQGRIFITPIEDNFDFENAMKKVIKVFGIISVSPVYQIETDFEKIKNCAFEIIGNKTISNDIINFKVEVKRGNKKFPLQSPEIARELGAMLLDRFSFLKVDVNKPELIVYVEVRENSYVYTEIIPSFGGMPLGTNGKAMLLLSGGIDSPVAGWMMAKRGVEIEAIHFYSYPYTSERAKEKVIDLAKILASFCGKIKLHIVPFTDIQLAINDKCPQDQMTIIMRREMMRIAETISIKSGCQALITGESMGQVASQTMQSLAVTNIVVEMPVFRPLIGMDKNEVVEIARKIDTFETSILPYEDCCTVFTAKHPETKPKLDKIQKSEALLDIDELREKAIQETKFIEL